MHVIATALSRYFNRIAPITATAAMIAASTVATPASQAVALENTSLENTSSVEQAFEYVDGLGRPTPLAVAKVDEFANQPFVPPQVADALHLGIGFLAGSGASGGPDLPQNGPAFTQFLWPTISPNCIGDGQHSTASAIAVPGPAEIPAPGAGQGQTSFVFTALGTPAAAQEQGAMDVYWINLDTFRTGVTPLKNNGINPTGPATVSGTADTGQGHVLAAVNGQVHTTENVCAFAPTAASIRVG